MHAASLGCLPEIEFQKAMAAPFGGAMKIIQRFDPLWGIGQKYPGRDAVKFEVQCTQKRIVEEVAFVKVEAYSQAHAEEIVRKMDHGRFDWDEDDEETDDFEIINVHKVKNDDRI